MNNSNKVNEEVKEGIEKHIVISMIGKGRKEKGGYQKTKYTFPNGKSYETTLFSIALYNYLKD